MSQAAIDYLKANKDKYSQDVLTESLRKAGYEAGDITKSIKIVYDVPEPAKNVGQEKVGAVKNFWDFRGAYFYKSKSEKVVEYIIGAVFPWVLAMLTGFLNYSLSWIALLTYIIAIFYFRKRRKYLFHGLMLSIYITLIFIVIGILVFTFGFGGYFF